MRFPVQLAAVLALALPAAASAQLPSLPVPQLPVPDLPVPDLPVPIPDPGDLISDPGQVVTDVGGTVGGALPGDVGGVVTTTTGEVGGIVSQTTSPVTGTVQDTVDQVLGSGGGTLPIGTIDQILGSLGVIPGANGRDGTAGSPGTNGGVVVIDGRAPLATVKVLSKVRQIGRTGKLKLRVTSDEPGVVAMGGTLRPGKKAKRSKRAHKSRQAKPVHFPAAVLAYRKAGALQVTIQFSRKAQKRIGKGRNARVSIALLAIDLSRNQSSSRFKKTIKR